MFTSIHGVIASSKNNASGWAQVGNSLSVAGGGTMVPAALSSTRIAVVDVVLDVIATYDWDGTDWTQTGSSLGLPLTNGTQDLTALSATRVAYIDGNNHHLTTYDFDGTNWAKVGNTFTFSFAGQTPAVTALNSTDVALSAIYSPFDPEVRTHRFDGTDWAEVGTGVAIPSQAFSEMTSLNSTDVVYTAHDGDELINYRFTPGADTWAEYGNRLDLTGATSPSLAALTPTRIAYIDATIDELRAYDFDGSTWTNAGGAIPFVTASGAGLTGLDTDLIALTSSNEIYTYQYF